MLRQCLRCAHFSVQLVSPTLCRRFRCSRAGRAMVSSSVGQFRLPRSVQSMYLSLSIEEGQLEDTITTWSTTTVRSRPSLASPIPTQVCLQSENYRSNPKTVKVVRRQAINFVQNAPEIVGRGVLKATTRVACLAACPPHHRYATHFMTCRNIPHDVCHQGRIGLPVAPLPTGNSIGGND